MKFPLTVFLLMAPIAGFAQRQNVYFLKNSGLKVELRDSADFIRVVREPDSGSVLYNVLEFHVNGKPRFVGKSSTIDPVKLEGAGLSYYKDGKRSQLANYKAGELSGQVMRFYPNGRTYIIKEYRVATIKADPGSDQDELARIVFCADSTGKVLLRDGNGYYREYDDHFKNILEEGPVKDGKRDSIWRGMDYAKYKFVERYQNGLMVSGEATDSLGEVSHYLKRYIPAHFKGGIEAFYKYLTTHINYPNYARRNDIQGRVFVSFVVKKDGQLRDLKVTHSVYKELDDEAIRVLSRSPLWVPGQLYGKPVNVIYTVPIAFALQEQ